MNDAKLSGITNIAIKALEITRFNIKIFVVIFRKFLFVQITYTTEKFKMMEAAITKTRRTSCAICRGDEVTRSSIPLWFVIFLDSKRELSVKINCYVKIVFKISQKISIYGCSLTEMQF